MGLCWNLLGTRIIDVSEDKSPSPARKAVTYAEVTLEVNSVYEGAQTLSREIAEAGSEVVALKSKRRDIETLLSERELDIITDEGTKHAAMSVAALERHLKVAIPQDDAVRELRRGITEVIHLLEEAETLIRSKEWDLKIAVARLQELGGYLNYLAAIKQAANIKSTEKPEIHT